MSISQRVSCAFSPIVWSEKGGCYNTVHTKNDTGNKERRDELEIPGMQNVSQRILRRDNVKYLIHIIENPVPLRSAVVILMSSNKVLDFRERLFDGIEIGRIGRQVLDANAESISELKEFSAVVNPGVVEDKDTEGAGIRAAEGKLAQPISIERGQEKVSPTYHDILHPPEKCCLRERSFN